MEGGAGRGQRECGGSSEAVGGRGLVVRARIAGSEVVREERVGSLFCSKERYSRYSYPHKPL
jgi:hypothetical protein